MPKHVSIDGYKFCKDEKTGYYLSSKLINGSRKRLHIYMWEKYNGPVPKGFHIHHINKNKSDNSIENLTILNVSEHLSLHSNENIEAIREKFIHNAHPVAKLWHASEEGKAWHREHAKVVAEKVYADKDITLICKNCFEEYPAYEAVKTRSDFCSNACKSAWRRKSGVDNEQRICEYCGNEFTTNKYTCSSCCTKSCAAKLRWIKRSKAQVCETSGF